MREVTLDCRSFVSRDAMHKAFAEALSFPDHYGSNLDALHDCLVCLPGETRLTLLHWQTAEASLGGYGRSLKRVLTDSEAENSGLHILYK